MSSNYIKLKDSIVQTPEEAESKPKENTSHPAQNIVSPNTVRPHGIQPSKKNTILTSTNEPQTSRSISPPVDVRLKHCYYNGWYPGYYGGYSGYPYYPGYLGYTPLYDYPYLSRNVNNETEKAVSIQEAQAKFDIVDISKTINYLRSLHGSPELTEDSTISTVSQNWADYLLNNNLFKHSGNPMYGENLAYFKGYGSNPILIIQQAINLWYREIDKYDFNNPGFSSETGHFTALVWKNSKTYGIGYAYKNDTDETIVVMNISPPGNVIGKFRENVMPLINTNPVPQYPPVPTPIPPVTGAPSPSSDLLYCTEENTILKTEIKHIKEDTIYKLKVLSSQVQIGSGRRYILQQIQTIIDSLSNHFSSNI